MIRINLLPPEYEAEQRKREQQILFGGLGGVVVIIMAGIWMLQAHRASALETKIVNAQAELTKFQAIVSQIEKIEQDKQRLTAKRDVIQNLNRSRLVYPVLFEDLLPLIPGDIWLTSMQIVEQGGNLKMTTGCRALSNFSIATWLSNLQQSKHFTSVELSQITYSSREGGGQELSFTLTSMYKHQGAFPLQDVN